MTTKPSAGPILLGCYFCDKNDQDSIDAIPPGWTETIKFGPTTEGFRLEHPDAPTHMGFCPDHSKGDA